MATDEYYLKPFTSVLLVPRLLDDPQTIPIFDQRYFIYDGVPQFCIELNYTTGNANKRRRSLSASDRPRLRGPEAPPPTLPTSTNVTDLTLMVMTAFQFNQVRDNLQDSEDVQPYEMHANYPAVLRIPVSHPWQACWEGQQHQYMNLQPTFFLLAHSQPVGNAVNVRLDTSYKDVTLGRMTRLSSGQIAEERLAGIAALAFGALAMLSLVGMLINWKADVKRNALKSLMTANVALKSLYLGLSYRNYVIYAATGVVADWRRLLPRTLAKLQDVMTLLVFLLVALGWQIFRHRLSQIEQRFCVGVALLSVYLALFEISVGGFQVSRYILAAVVYLCIVIAVNFSLAALSAVVAEHALTPRVASWYGITSAYQTFRMIFIAYVLKPSMLLVFSLLVIGNETSSGLYLLTGMDYFVDFCLLACLNYTFFSSFTFPLIKVSSFLLPSPT